MKTFTTSFIFIISALCLSVCEGQNTDTLFYKGMELFKSGNETGARSLLLKTICFDTSLKYSAEAYYYLGDIEALKSDYSKAHLYYDYSYSLAKDTVVRNEILVKKTLLYLQTNDYSFAASTARMILAVPADTALYRFKSITSALDYLTHSDFSSAQNSILGLMETAEDSLEIETIFRSKKAKSVKKAMFISAFIPGSGQIYLGDLKNGINSFLLVGTLGYLVINTAVIYNPLSSALIVFPWWLRYYLGGIKKTGTIYAQKNKQQQREIYSRLIDYLTKKNYFRATN